MTFFILYKKLASTSKKSFGKSKESTFSNVTNLLQLKLKEKKYGDNSYCRIIQGFKKTILNDVAHEKLVQRGDGTEKERLVSKDYKKYTRRT